MRKFLKSLKSSKLASSAVALVLAFSVLLSTFGGMSLMADTSDVWGGEVASSFAYGTGNETDPYVIANGAQLRLMVEQGSATQGKYYKLANDIYLNDVSATNWYQATGLNTWDSMQISTDNAFKGHFDGNGCKVFGLYLNTKTANTVAASPDTTTAAGLIPVVGAGATVTAVGVEKAYISITNSVVDDASTTDINEGTACNKEGYVGGVAGTVLDGTEAEPITFTYCYASDSVQLTGLYAGALGVANGGAPYVSIANCYSAVSASVYTGKWNKTSTYVSDEINNRAAIIAGNGSQATYDYCWSTANIAGTNSKTTTSINYCGSWAAATGTRVAIEDLIGESAKTAMPGLNWDTVYMTTSSYPILRIFYEEQTPIETGKVWDGTTSAPNEGAGTAVDPYLIDTAEELAYVVANGGDKVYKLTANIYLNDVSSVNWSTGAAIAGYTPNEWYSGNDADGSVYNGGKIFKGTIDGNGFTVYGLYYKPGDLNTAAGLVPVATDATVKNLRIANSFISGGRWVSAVLGYSTNITVSNVVVDKTVTIHGYNSGVAYYNQTAADKIAEGKDGWPFNAKGMFQSTGTGGVVGYAISKVTMTDVASYATIKEKEHTYTVSNALINDGAEQTVGNSGHTGGLIGTAWNTAITVSDAVSSYSPFDGKNGSGAQNFTDVYTTDSSAAVGTVVSASAITGDSAKTTLSGLDFDTVWTVTEDLPTLQIFSAMDPSEYWSGAAVEPTVGTGSDTDPYIISTAEELAYIVKNGMPAGKYYKLANDIYLNDITKIDWTTGQAKTGYEPKSWYNTNEVGTLAGNFNGDGHMIYGLYYKNNAANYWSLYGTGLFPKASDGLTISKLGVDYAYVKHPAAAGALVGGAVGDMTTTIDQCFVGANTTVIGNDAGAFIGAADSTLVITNAYSLATVTAVANSGLVGEYYGYGSDGPSTSTFKHLYNAKGKIAKQMAATAEGLYVTIQQDGATLLTDTEMQGLDVVTTGAMSGLGAMFQGTTTYPILTAFAPVKPAPETGVWDGTTKTAPSEGAGTEASPYIIYNAAELAYVISNDNAGKYYKLANDIYINEVDKVDWATGTPVDGYTPNTWLSYGIFAGNLDGNGHTVHGIYYRATTVPSGVPAVSGRGLFPIAGNGFNVTKLAVDDSYLEHYASYSLGAIFGQVNASVSGEISYSHIGKNVTVKGYDAGGFFGGGPRSGSNNIVMDHCYSWGTVTFTNRGGAFYGDSWANAGETGAWVITNSYCVGKISHAGGYRNVTNSYTIGGPVLDGFTLVTEEDATGLNVFNFGSPMQKLNSDKAWEATSGYPILDVFSETSGNDGEEYVPESDTDANGIWTGVILETFSDNTSTGTADDPIVLATPGELALAITSGGNGKYYKLAADMYLNDVSSAGWYMADGLNSWFSVTASNAGFSGHIDGAGHIVYGIWYPANTTGAVGLVPRMSSGSIKNLGVRYSYIRSTQNLGAGGLIGYASGVITIEQCFADETVMVISTTAGGLVGLMQQNYAASTKGLVIKNCYSKAAINSTSAGVKANGLIGDSWISAYEIYDSYSIGMNPYGIANNGSKSAMYWYHTTKYDEEKKTWVTDVSEAKAGKKASDYFKDVYTDAGSSDNVDRFWTQLDNSDMYGEAAKTKMSGLDFENVWTVTKEGSPILKIFEGKVTGEDIDTSADAAVYASGSGKENDPYIIKTADQLFYLVQSETTKGKYYELANDIYINDTSKANWKTNARTWYTNLSNSAFAGTLEGNGYSIYGLYINETPSTSTEDYIGGTAAGLFSYATSGAIIRNVHIRNSYVSGYGNTGAFVGHTKGTASTPVQIIGCSIDESVTVRGFTTGGFVGCAFPAPANLYYCYSTADIDGNNTEDRINSFIGDSWSCSGELIECYATGHRMLRGNYALSKVYSDTYSSGVTVVPLANMYGTAAKTAMSKLNWTEIWKTVNGKTPQLKVVPAGMTGSSIDEGVKGRVWSGNIASKFAGGTGTESDPYLIETPEQMAMLISKGSKAGTYYKLMADLKLNDTTKSGWTQNANQWYVGKSFSGHFDGNGHVVSGLYYETEGANYCGLFPYITASTTIKRVGLTDSYVSNPSTSGHTYSGGIVGFIENWDGYMGASLSADGKTNKWGGTAPVFSECFVSASVVLKGDTCGGIYAGAACGVEMYNCYAVCELTCSYRGGGLFGDNWESGEGVVIIENSYCATLDSDSFGTGPKTGDKTSIFDTVYVDGSVEGSGANRVSLYYMQGTRALDYMPTLDYDKVWKTVAGGTPVLRCFANAEKYSSRREPTKVSISFVTGDGGSAHDPIYGLPLIDKIDYSLFPTPTRYGYEFVTWHFFDTCDLEFDLEVFPLYDCFAYAEWKPVGFTQGWEGDNNDQYDINGSAIFYQPGVSGYNPRYIHGGLRSVKTLAETGEQPMFLLCYETKLEVGKEYDVNFWMTSREDGVSGTIEVFHSNYADVNDTYVGYQTGLEFTDLQGGVWKQYKITLIANGPYLMFRTPAGVELYFDDVQVVPTGNEGELGEGIKGFNPEEISTEPESGLGLVWIIVIVAGGVVLLAAVAAVVTVVVKNKKKNGAKAATEPEAPSADDNTPAE